MAGVTYLPAEDIDAASSLEFRNQTQPMLDALEQTASAPPPEPAPTLPPLSAYSFGEQAPESTAQDSTYGPFDPPGYGAGAPEGPPAPALPPLEAYTSAWTPPTPAPSEQPTPGPGLSSPGAPLSGAGEPSAPVPAAGGEIQIDRSSPQAFLGSFVGAAKQALASKGLPQSLAPILAAIPMNEQGWQAEAPGNNYYGIKGSNPRTGANTGAVSTWEDYGGGRQNITDTFRAYGGPAESVADFIQFLEDNPRYGKALEVARSTGDPASFIRAVHAAGYATDPAWSDKILSIARSVPNVPDVVGGALQGAGQALGNVASAAGQAVQSLVGRKPPESTPASAQDRYSIAFGFDQPYGDAQFNANIPRHRGVDLVIRGAENNGRGQPVGAFQGGTVAAITQDPNGGNGVIVRDADGLYHRYFHFDRVAVQQGQQVAPGETLGILGASGTEGFPHVHFEVSKALNGDPMGQTIDPRPYMATAPAQAPEGSAERPLPMSSGDAPEPAPAPQPPAAVQQPPEPINPLVTAMQNIGGALNAGRQKLGEVFPVLGQSDPLQPHHDGAPGAVDVFAPRGAPVVATQAGKVLFAGRDKDGGNVVVTASRDGQRQYYAHLDGTPLVQTGDIIPAGQPLGNVGNTGNAEGKDTQLHYGEGDHLDTQGNGVNGDVLASLQAGKGAGLPAAQAYEPGPRDVRAGVVDDSTFGPFDPPGYRGQPGDFPEVPPAEVTQYPTGPRPGDFPETPPAEVTHYGQPAAQPNLLDRARQGLGAVSEGLTGALNRTAADIGNQFTPRTEPTAPSFERTDEVTPLEPGVEETTRRVGDLLNEGGTTDYYRAAKAAEAEGRVPDMVGNSIHAAASIAMNAPNMLAQAMDVAAGAVGASREQRGAPNPLGTGEVAGVQVPGLRGAGQWLGVPEDARVGIADIIANMAPQLAYPQLVGLVGAAIEHPYETAAQLGITHLGGVAVGAAGRGISGGLARAGEVATERTWERAPLVHASYEPRGVGEGVVPEVARAAARAGEEGQAPNTMRQAPRQERAAELSRPIVLTDDAQIARIRLDKQFPAELSDDLLNAARGTGFGQRLRRGVLSDEAVQTLAEEYAPTVESAIATSRRGRAYNAEEVVAVRNLMVGQAERAKTLATELAEGSMTRDERLATQAQLAMEQKKLALLGDIVFGGAPAEAGRALRQFKDMAQSLESDPATAGLRYIKQQFGSLEAAEEVSAKYLTMVQTGADPIELAKFLRGAKGGWLNRLNILRYAGMLSGTVTHAVNASGNALLQGLDVATAPIAVGIDVARVRGARALGQSAEREIFLAETPARLHGMLAGATTGLQDAAFTMAHGIRPEDVTKLDHLHQGFGTNIPGIAPAGSRVAGAVDFIVEGPLRALSAGDAIFRSIARGGHTAAEATARAMRDNGGKKASLESVDRAMSNPEVVERADELARRSVLQEDTTARKFAGWLRQQPPAVQTVVSQIVPFVSTPYSIIAQGVGMTPAGVVKAIADAKAGKGARNVQETLARVTLGTAIMQVADMQYLAGNLTGPRPEDEAERSTLPPGWREWSFRVTTPGGGVQYVPMALAGPLAVPMVVGVLKAEAAKKKQPLSLERTAEIALGIGRFAADQTFFQGVAQLSAALDKGGSKVESYIEQIAGQYSPHVVGGGALGREIQQVAGMPQRDPQGAIEALLATHPLTAGKVPVRRDVLGRPAQTSPGGVESTVVRATVERDAPVLRAYRRAGEGLPTQAPKDLRDPDEDRRIPLNRRQQDLWRVAFGAELQRLWQDEDKPTDIETLRRIEDQAREEAAFRVLGR